MRFQELESRVTPAQFIVTPHDKIPDFGESPSIVAVASGSWSNPSTWSTGLVPSTGAVVSINSGFTVTYDVVSNAVVKTVAIQSGGALHFRTDIDTRLTVVNFLDKQGGKIQIGTEANPVESRVKAEVIFADVPLDLANDPQQYGNGLIGLGQVTVYGSEVSDTFVRLAAEPLAGATKISLAEPVFGWKIGDKIILPDTRELNTGQRFAAFSSQKETATITAIAGNVISISQPLQYNHKASRSPDGVIRYMPHVGLISHNVAFRSQSSAGTRGHVMFTHRAEVDINNAAFQGLGRTQNLTDDNTVLNSAGQPTHIGTNQAGRYPVFFNHLLGKAYLGPVLPVGQPAGDPQFTFDGNSVSCLMNTSQFRWGLVVTDSSNGLIEDNVIYNWGGAGVAVTNGSEVGNVFNHNLVVGIKGDTNPRDNLGRDGMGFWTVGFNNSFRDNVAADIACTFQGIVAGSGYNLFAPAATSQNTRVPLYPGADTTAAGQYQLVDIGRIAIREFTRNEAYGAMATGLTLWHLGTTGYGDKVIAQSVVKDFVSWHIWEDGFFGYPINNVLFDGFTVIGDSTMAVQNGSNGWLAGDYWASEVIIRNAHIEGRNRGIAESLNTPISFRVENSFLRNHSNIEIETLATPGSRAIKPARSTVIDNVRFQNHPGASTFKTVTMKYNGTREGSNFIQRDEVFVLNHNGVTGDNFQLYYTQQAPNFIVPKTTYYGPDANADGIGDWVDSLGEPVANLTNAQAWTTYGTAIAGAVAPTTQTRANVTGLVRALAPVKVASTTLNAGEVQRSAVTELLVQFSQPVTFSNGAAAFEVKNSAGVTVPFAVTFGASTGAQSTAKLQFKNSAGAFATLNDGAYSLVVKAAQVTDLTGNQLDGDGNGTGGDNYNFSFHRLYGDVTGDRTVDNSDFRIFRNSFNSSLGQASFMASLDGDRDNAIDQDDMLRFRSAWGMIV